MHNDPTKHPSDSERNHVNHVRKADDRGKKRNFAGFLIESDIKPFMFVGKCIQYFGWGTVAGVFLGAICVYGYAVFYKPLPYAKVVTEPIVQPTPQNKTVQLRGLVRNSADEPAKWFHVGVFANQQGPLTNSDGSFNIEVPQSDSYDVAYWIDDQTVGFFQRNPAEPDGNGYKLQNVLKFPPKNQDASAVVSKLRISNSTQQLARLDSRGR